MGQGFFTGLITGGVKEAKEGIKSGRAAKGSVLSDTGWNKTGKEEGMFDVNRKVTKEETFTNPKTGEKVVVTKGKSLAEVSPETAEFYSKAADRINAEGKTAEETSPKDFEFKDTDIPKEEAPVKGKTPEVKPEDTVFNALDALDKLGVDTAKAGKANYDWLTAGKEAKAGAFDNAVGETTKAIDQAIEAQKAKGLDTAQLEELKAEVQGLAEVNRTNESGNLGNPTIVNTNINIENAGNAVNALLDLPAKIQTEINAETAWRSYYDAITASPENKAAAMDYAVKRINESIEAAVKSENISSEIKTELMEAKAALEENSGKVIVDSSEEMRDNGKVRNAFKSKQELLKKSTCTNDDFYRYLKKIDKNAADKYIKNGNWPDNVQIPKSPDVLNPDGSIKWGEAAKGGYVLDKEGNADKKKYSPFIGEIIDRFGPEDGRYTCPVVDGKIFKYELRALPFVEDASQYHQYKVIGDFTKIKEYVTNCTDLKLKAKIEAYIKRHYGGDYKRIEIFRGKIASAFNEIGGGLQYELPMPIEWLERLGLLRNVY